MILIGSMPTSAQKPTGSGSASSASSASSSADTSSTSSTPATAARLSASSSTSAASPSAWNRASSSAAGASAAASTSGVITTSSMASSTSSQRSAITSVSSVQRRSPSRPVNGNVPWSSRSKPSAAPSTSVTASSSHTSARDRTMATIWASSSMVHVSGSSAASSGTPTRSNWCCSSGSSSGTLSFGTTGQAGWSVRSCSVAVRTNAARCAASGNPYRSSSSPRNASQSSPSSRQRGAQSVTTSPCGS